jgi:hypothetical protein
MAPGDYPRVMGTLRAGGGTATGSGDIIYDDQGHTYRIVDRWEAERIRNSTGGTVRTLHQDGTIR